MENFIKKTISHPLISGSVIIFTGSFIANIFNFLFNLFMSRNLSSADFGILASLTSLVSLPWLAAGALIPIVISFAASYFAKRELEKVHGLFIKIYKIVFVISALFSVIFIVSIPMISEFFHINNWMILFISNFIIILGICGIVNLAFLQARLSFTYIALTNFISAILKLLFGVVFIYLGYRIVGAVGAIFASSVITYFLLLYPLRFLFNKNNKEVVINMKEIYQYGIPAMLTLLSLTLLISTDIFLVKHFFSASDAGIYAGISLIGKVIFYFSAPISSVMFPLIVRKHANKEKFNSTFLLSLFLIIFASTSITFFYFLFPGFTITLFIKKQEYLAGVPFLGIFGIFITLYSLLSLLANFYLSLKKTKVYIPLVIGALLQAVLIWIYHRDFLQIITISIIIVTILNIVLLIYYFKDYGKK